MTSTTAATTDAARFAELLERHRGIVLKVASTYCRNTADRDDLVQEIAAQLWRALPSFDPGRTFSTWMYRVALNVAISFVRAHRTRERYTVPFDEALHDAADENAADATADDQLALLYACIDRLEPLDRALLLLYLDERSYREIAEILGISATNVATKIGRLKQRLREETQNGDR